MNVMILAAGFGQRLMPYTKRLPKPLFPVLDRTLLDLAIETAKGANPARIVVNAHHLGGQIKDYVAAREYGVEVIVSVEEEILGTAGGIRRAWAWLEGGEVAVINADTVAEVDWGRLAEFHRRSGALATLLLRDNPDPKRYGVLGVDAAGKVTRFLKAAGPGADKNSPPLMFTGISILSRAFVERIPEGRPVDIAGEIYEPMVQAGEPVYGQVTQGRWIDAGTPADYLELVMKSLENVPWAEPPPGVTVIPPVHIAPGATICAGAALGPYVSVGEGAVVGAGARLTRCVALPGARAPDAAVLDGAII
ncbi:MAG: NDP-sugar synthase [Nitrospinae bacterium]|nr:NDP-sugar synthase [Nitrospinota bacterium]